MSDENERSPASAGSQPEAWANEDDDGIYAVGPSEAHARYVWERAANGKYSHRNPRIVPLYRQPQPTLTDEEQLAIAWAAREADEWDEEDTPEVAAHAEVLRGLAKRLF
jgi:hypothetical protein